MAQVGETHIAVAVMADHIIGHTVAAGEDPIEGVATPSPGVGAVTMTIEDLLRDIMAALPWSQCLPLKKQNVLHLNNLAATETI
jgi:hypothetical protein